MKVLVVDDATTMRRILINILAKLNLTDINEATDGAQAVERVSSEDYGLVLMDWNMPNLSGIEALKAMRAAGKKMPVIMVTTEGEKSRVLEAMRAGATNYIVKPFNPDTVLLKIKETLGLNTPTAG